MSALCLQIHLQITDEAAFRESARQRALADGLSKDAADEFLDEDEMSLAACATMLFDPGVSPHGCQILETCEAP